MKKPSLIRVAVILACLPATAFADPGKIAGTPVHLAISQVTEKTLRFEILPLDAEGKTKPTPSSTIFAPFNAAEKVRIQAFDIAKTTETQIGTLKVTVRANPVLNIAVHKADGKLVQEIIFKEDGSFSFHTDAPTFGLGEGRQQFDRRGFYYNFQNGQNQFLATHGATVPVPFLIGSDGWGMFIHNPPPNGTPQPNTAWGQFDLRGDDAGTPPAPARGPAVQQALTPPAVLPTRGRYIPRQDVAGQAPVQIYIMNLDTPADALTEYTHLVGKPVMPPKWTMGYMQSHRSLAGPDEVLNLVKKFRNDKLPCDAVIYLGTGYTVATQPNIPFGGWNVRNGSLEFNPAIFDKPQEMIDKIHALNFKIIMHKTNAPANLSGTVNDVSTNPNNVGNYWATHVPLVKMGIDAWWPDDGDELPIENRMARIRAYYDGPLKELPNERPWSLNRNGYAGVAKYGGWNWSGDNVSTWSSLKVHVPVGVQFSFSCSPWWGTDIGGFSGSQEYSGELYTRWFQFGAFNPLFRSHGRNWHLHTPFGWAPAPDMGPGWQDGEFGPRESTLPAAATLQQEIHNAAVQPACKLALELRYQLLPYNYTITREACDTGMPLMRAHLLTNPSDPEAVKLGDQYMWGPSLLVAPVVEKGATTRRLYLPGGTWYDWWTGERTISEKITVGTRSGGVIEVTRAPSADGGQWIDRKVELSTIPLYVKAGAIIPLDPIRQYTAEKVTEPTTLRIYPGNDGTFTLYDDDGHTMAYATAADPSAQWIKFTWQDGAKKLAIEADPRMKVPAGFSRTFKVQLMGDSASAPREVTFRGAALDVAM